MSAPGLPRLPWYPRDFRASTLLWPLIARACYRELLDLAWDVGGLPAEPEELRAVLGASTEEWGRAWPFVEAKFPIGDDGLRRNPRLELHRADAQAMREAKRKGAAVTNAKRWGTDSHSDSQSDAPTDSHSDSQSDRSSESPPAPAPAPAPEAKREGASPPVPQAGPDGARSGPGELDLQATDPPKPDQVQRVFNHWREVHRHPRAVLDVKRRRLIAARLREYSAADLCRAISGYLHSPHHMGQNDRGTTYTDLALLLRDASHVDAGLRFADRPPVPAEPENASARIARKLADEAGRRQTIEGEAAPALGGWA